MKVLVGRIAASETFYHCPRLRSLLIYLTERRLADESEELHEHEIGVSFFGRPENYSSGDDNIVRVSVRKLRAKLAEYFAGEGKDEAYVVEIPKGSYVPVVHPRTADAAVPIPLSSRLPLWRAVALAAAVMLAGFGIWLLAFEAGARSAAQRGGDTISSLAFSPENRTFVVVADSGLVVWQWFLNREISMDDYLSREYASIADGACAASGALDLCQLLRFNRYTSIADVDTYARIRVANPADAKRIVLRHARDVQIHDLRSDNAILIGSSLSNPWVRLLEPALNFRFRFRETTKTPFIANRARRSAEPLEFFDESKPGESGTQFAQVAMVSGVSNLRRVLVIAGTSSAATAAAGEFVTSPGSLEALQQRLGTTDARTLQYFEIVFRVPVAGGSARELEIVAVRGPADA